MLLRDAGWLVNDKRLKRLRRHGDGFLNGETFYSLRGARILIEGSVLSFVYLSWPILRQFAMNLGMRSNRVISASAGKAVESKSLQRPTCRKGDPCWASGKLDDGYGPVYWPLAR